MMMMMEEDGFIKQRDFFVFVGNYFNFATKYPLQKIMQRRFDNLSICSPRETNHQRLPNDILVKYTKSK